MHISLSWLVLISVVKTLGGVSSHFKSIWCIFHRRYFCCVHLHLSYFHILHLDCMQYNGFINHYNWQGSYITYWSLIVNLVYTGWFVIQYRHTGAGLGPCGVCWCAWNEHLFNFIWELRSKLTLEFSFVHTYSHFFWTHFLPGLPSSSWNTQAVISWPYKM